MSPERASTNRIAWAVGLFLTCTASAARAAPPVATPTPPPPPKPAFRLSSLPGAQPPPPPAPVTTLPAADARKLFAGVPDLPAAATPTTPPVQAPRPRATRVIVPTSRAAPLPPRVSGARGPLRILRRQPEGEVTTIAVVSVTFSEPMRALDQQPAAPPVRLTPAVDGAWRWVDAQTARFEPAQALPFATAFEVVVPAGTAAVSGTRLPDEVRWAFRTPPPKLAELDFHEVAEAEPLVWLVFDQPVDQAEVLQHLRVTRDGEAIAARVAEVAEDQRVWSVRELALDRWLAVRVAAGTGDWERLRVELTAGMPGKVGTLRTAAVQGFEKVRERPVLQRVCREDVPQGDPSGVVRCDVEKVCTPVRTGPHAGTQVCQRTLGLQFAPALDPTTLRPGVASCDPPVALQDWQHRYGDESLSGVFEVGKRYRLVFGPELRSEEGRRAGKVQEVLLEVEPEEPSVSVNLYAGSVGPPDPNAKVEITARNATAVDVELRRVEADELWKRGADALPSESRWSREEMKAWKKAWNEAQRKAGREVPPEPTPVWRGRVPLTAGAYGSLRASVPLAPALRDGRGVVVVRATVPGTDVEAESWAVFTNLDVSIRQDGTQWVARVWNRDTGRPSPAALLRTGAPEWTWLRTDRDGFARMRHAYGDMLVVSTERDFAIFEPSVFSACTNIVEGFPAENQWLWHVVDDRGLYRPGDTVRLAGWARQLERGPQGGLRMPDGRPATWVLRGPRHDEVGKGEVALDRNGAFRFEVVLPVDADPGRWSVVLVPPEDETEKDPWDRWRRREPNHAHALQVAEFVRPAFEVTATLSDGPFVTGERAVASLRSGYLAQGGLAEAEVSWALALADKQQRRWQADGFLFGDHGDRYATHDEVELPQSATLLQARTDAHGEHRLALDLADAAPGLPSNLVLQATVLDANRKGRSTQPLELRVHPARVQVGLRATAEGSKKSGRLRVETRVVDLVGAILPGRPVSVQVQPLVQREGAWEPGEPQTCQVASAAAPVACAFRVAPCSRQRIEARVTDEAGRVAWSRAETFLPCGKTPARQPVEPDDEEGGYGMDPFDTPEPPSDVVVTTRLEGDRLHVQLATTARDAVQASVLLLRDGVVHAMPVELRQGRGEADLLVKPEWAPGVTVEAEVIVPQPLRKKARATRADAEEDQAWSVRRGNAQVAIPYRTRLGVQVDAPRGRVPPGTPAPIRVAVTDADGRPRAGARVVLVVLDAAVLALRERRVGDPHDTFHFPMPPWTQAFLLGWGPAVASRPIVMCAASFHQSSEVGASGSSSPALRDRFDAVAAFLPDLETGPDGVATATVTLPHDLTRWRVFAYASSGVEDLGSGEATFQAGLPLAVRVSPPRFASKGDRFDLTALVQNLSDTAQVVEVAARATGLRIEGDGRRVEIPAGGRREVAFGAEATTAGTATVQVTALGTDGIGDAQQASFEVVESQHVRRDATSVEVGREPVRVPVALGPEVATDAGGLDLRTAATPLLDLEPTLGQLVQDAWPWPSSLAARLQGLAALGSLAEQVQLPDGTLRDGEMALVDTTRELLKQRNWRGWGWPGGRDEPDAWITTRIAHAATLAARSGSIVAQRLASNAGAVSLQATALPEGATPTDAAVALRAYALYVQHLGGEPDRAEAAKWADRLDVHAPTPTIAWLLPVLAGDPERGPRLRRMLESRIVAEGDRATVAEWGAAVDDRLRLGSSTFVDALVLDALASAGLSPDVTARLARGVLARRSARGFGGETTDAFALSGLGAWMRTAGVGRERPEVSVWLGDTRVAVHRPVLGAAEATALPMAQVADQRPAGAPVEVVLANAANSPAWVRVGVTAVLRDTRAIPARDQGLRVERRYLAAGDPADVQVLADDVVRVRAGAVVRVQVDVDTTVERTLVSVRDLLPAGFEALDPSLVGEKDVGARTQPRNEDGGAEGLRFWTVLRDRRADGFARILPPGRHRLQYLARATTVGRFVAAPAFAVQLDAPEVSGSSPGVVVDVVR